MARFIRSLLIFLPLFLVQTGCGSDSTAPIPTVNGTWSGSSGTIVLSLTLSQSGSTITGNGQITSSTSLALTATGTFIAPNVSLTLNAPGFQPINYAGPLSGNVITGTLNGSGFVNIAIPLTKQP